MSSVKTDKDNSSIVTEYLQLTNKYTEQYGENTIVLLQVGAFFEMYALKDNITEEVTGSKIEEVCRISQLNISEKKFCVGNEQVLMAGFRDYSLDNYLQKMTDGGYTVVVYVQEKNGKSVTRKLHSIYSAGTYVSYETDSYPKLTNNIMCVWIQCSKSVLNKMDNMVCGISVVNIFTGKSFIFEYQIPFMMNPTTFDDLERCVSVFSPSEIIFISGFENSVQNKISQYSGIANINIHYVNFTNENVEKCKQQKYIKHILSIFFGDEAYELCSEFNTYTIATQSFCYLLNFIQEHNPNLVKKIMIPMFNNTSDRMILANHTLKQLNIIDDMSSDGKKMGKLSSVLSFINNCCSAMGKRLLYDSVTNPTFNNEQLNKEYAIVENLIHEDNYFLVEYFRKQIKQIYDIEKMTRQIVIQKIYPASLFNMYQSIQVIQAVNACIKDRKEFIDYIPVSMDIVEKSCSRLMDILNTRLNIQACKGITNNSSYEKNIIHRGVSIELDEIEDRLINETTAFTTIKDYLNNLMPVQTGTSDYVKIHETEKSGSTLQITKVRGKILKERIEEKIKQGANIVKINDKLSIDIKDLKLSTATTSNDEINFPELTKLCRSILTLKEKMNNTISKVYIEILTFLEQNNLHDLETISKFISLVDLVQCKTYIARENNYCKPIIDSSAEKSFVNAKGIRHCLIEHIQHNELYVPNDIEIGASSPDGILLYGTNAVGKTSLIRSLGICIVLAQSGFFVPCTHFMYKPYTAIYSRILGNDNLFKGLSTFAVEMSELRVILKMADENSFIIGDEICSGTETESALSIFVSSLDELYNKKSSYIFATHFHEIVNYDEVKALDSLHMKHMSVIYDREKDCLVYDRKLKDGPGIKCYGLEVCKSLYLPQEFLDKAYKIRSKYFPETNGELSATVSTKYNSQKIKNKCEMCEIEMADEIHHINPQKYADKNGFIETFHKNHPANLMALCEKCHDSLHVTQNVTIRKIRKKTTKGYTTM